MVRSKSGEGLMVRSKSSAGVMVRPKSNEGLMVRSDSGEGLMVGSKSTCWFSCWFLMLVSLVDVFSLVFHVGFP